MCATKTLAVPACAGERSPFVAAMMVIVGAFQDALAMRRAVQKSYQLYDE